MREKILQRAESWADTARLRSEMTCQDAECHSYTVEDALVWCVFYLWAAEHLEEA